MVQKQPPFHRLMWPPAIWCFNGGTVIARIPSSFSSEKIFLRKVLG